MANITNETTPTRASTIHGRFAPRFFRSSFRELLTEGEDCTLSFVDLKVMKKNTRLKLPNRRSVY
jgi:hypothetical protein